MDKKSCKATFQPYCGKKKSKRKNQNSSCCLHMENILIPVATCKWITSTLMFVKCTNSVNLIRRDGKELLINYKMICKKASQEITPQMCKNWFKERATGKAYRN